MTNIITAVFASVLLLGIIGLASVLGGTLVWMLWPIAIPSAFPALVTSGVITPKLTWGASVSLTWVLSILFKAVLINGPKT